MNLKFKRKNGEVLKVYSNLFADKKNKTYGLITIEQLLNNGEYVEQGLSDLIETEESSSFGTVRRFIWMISLLILH